MLETSDIREDEMVENPEIFGTQNVEDVPYPVEMARLARICKDYLQNLGLHADSDSAHDCLNAILAHSGVGRYIFTTRTTPATYRMGSEFTVCFEAGEHRQSKGHILDGTIAHDP